jgi:Fe-S-cluster-containing hydrogenase component 2
MAPLPVLPDLDRRTALKKTMLVEFSKCTGCELCVEACSAEKVGVYSEKASRIRIDKDEAGAVFVPLLCEQCREQPCVDACPVDAIRYDENISIFKVDGETCTGCGACETACPYGGIFVPEGVALKCDLCSGNPACVEVCYPGALRYVEVSEDTVRADLECKAAKLARLKEGKDE